MPGLASEPQDRVAEADAERSRAFESLVSTSGDPDGADDIIGLLAYALYKAHIREALRDGRSVHRGRDRVPTETEISAYRGAAERRLIAFAESAVEQATPGIEQAGVVREVAAVKADIVAEIRIRTSYRTAITANVVGWLVSIAITVLVVLSGVPEWVLRLASRSGTP